MGLDAEDDGEGGEDVTKFTREQAAIIGAYTGFLAGPFEDMHAYAEKKLGRPVWTHEFANRDVVKGLREVSREDFVALCAEREKT